MQIMAHSTPHRGAQAVVHVHQFQGWPQAVKLDQRIQQKTGIQPTEMSQNLTGAFCCSFASFHPPQKKLGNLHNLGVFGVSKFLSTANFRHIHLQS